MNKKEKLNLKGVEFPLGASDYIKQLIISKEAHIAPGWLLREKGQFNPRYLRGKRISGYKASYIEEDGKVVVDLDKVVIFKNGRARVVGKGVGKTVLFEGKVGTAPNQEFIVISRAGSTNNIALIVK